MIEVLRRSLTKSAATSSKLSPLRSTIPGS
jgi:hypothetical protein